MTAHENDKISLKCRNGNVYNKFKIIPRQKL